MNLVRHLHCNLCDYQKMNLKVGSTCGLTGKKPDFHRTCTKIELNDKFEDVLENLNIEYENIRRKKIVTYLYFVLFFTIGIAAILGSYFYGKHIYNSDYTYSVTFSKLPIIFVGIGIALLGYAVNILSRHLQKYNVAKSNKENTDKVLKTYRIEYDIDIKFSKGDLGLSEVWVDLRTKGNR